MTYTYDAVQLCKGRLQQTAPDKDQPQSKNGEWRVTGLKVSRW